jgi:hypothetical protein
MVEIFEKKKLEKLQVSSNMMYRARLHLAEKTDGR